MKVFISWSGELSHNIAKLLKEWIENVIQSAECFLSSEDIDKGTRWFSEISKELDNTNLGIICVTNESMNAPWLLFEAGALSKKVEHSYVCPLLIDLAPSDLKGPLTHFQSTHPTQDKNEMYKLIKIINTTANKEEILDEERLKRSYNQWWEDYLSKLKPILAEKLKEIVKTKTKRDDREILEEVLILCRSMSQELSSQRMGKDVEELLSSILRTMNASVSPSKPSLRNAAIHNAFAENNILSSLAKGGREWRELSDQRAIRGEEVEPAIRKVKSERAITNIEQETDKKDDEEK